MQRTIYLDENEFPKSFYNILPDLPEKMAPYMDPKTKEPATPQQMSVLFPMELLKQEVNFEDRYIPIPAELREVYLEKLDRPRPLMRATNLEKHLNLPSNVKIFYKREDLSVCGSHKPNTAVAQAYYAKKEGVTGFATETGAGQWGSSLAYAGSLFDLDVEVFMVRCSYEQKPYRKIMMNLFGASVLPSPSDTTNVGRQFLAEGKSTGSLGIAIAEAIERAAATGKKYSLGSVLNFVCLHQTIIGQEALKQMQSVDEMPTHVIGCFGGGSNFAGIAFPFYELNKTKNAGIKLVAVEPETVPSLTKGKFEYDHGDSAGLTPLIQMYTLGKDFMPPSIYAGGLRYHGAAPSVSLMMNKGLMSASTVGDGQIFPMAQLFAKTEGIIPAPESTHAIAETVRLALEAKKKGEAACLLFNLSGHGLMDMAAYDKSGEKKK